MPEPSSRPFRSGRPLRRTLLLWAALLGTTSQALSQETDLGPATAGGPGFRGTVDASDLGNTINDLGLPNAGPATLSTPAKVVAPRFQLPKLRNTALPDRYPVPLPPLAPYPRALRRQAQPVDGDVAVEPGPTVAALPVLARRTIQPDADPFGPIGYGIGSTRILPSITQSFGYDSNPEQIQTGVKGSAYSRTEGGVVLQSDWSAHELTGVLHGGYNEFFSNPRADRPDANGVVDLRLDVSRDTSIDTEVRFNIDTQRPGSPELNVAVRDRPLIESFGGTFGVTQAVGRFSVGLHGLVDRTAYEDGTLTDGRPVALAYQDVNDYGVKGRVAYDLKPGLQPFVEIGYDQRLHDQTVDPFGYRRDSDGIGGRVGSTFEFWPQMTGTASAGYATRFYDDARLKTLSGPTAAASLAWAATPLTTLTLQASTAFNETTVIGASGIEARSIGVALSHALFRYLTVTGALAYERDDYVGAPIVESTFTASLKAEYHLTRSIVVTGTLSHQTLSSTIAGSSYDQEIALVGLRVQH